MNTAYSSFILLRQGDQGFTLVEILLVLVLLALGGAILLSAAGGIFGRAAMGNPEQVVAMALQQARREAVVTGREIALRFNESTRRFAFDGGTGPEMPAAPGETHVDFLRPEAASSVLIGGRRVGTASHPVLRFFPDGTCEPVRVQIRAEGGPSRILSIDPWTCAPGLEAQP